MESSSIRKSVLLFASAVLGIILGIVAYSVPYIYPILKEKFDVSSTMASGAIAVFMGVGYFFGKLWFYSLFHIFTLLRL